MKMLKRAGQVVLFVGIAFLPALSAVFVQTGGWYEALYKPEWNPPAAVFGPVWSALYLIIGLAGYFAWTRGPREHRRAEFSVYGAQLVLNALWTPVFFGLHRPDLALAVLILLWFQILLCIALFSLRSFAAALLMLPYFIWISFAGALNATILFIN
ncbi:MAG TPA: tryptophan-rich sensory protein [Pontiellaceae bacterium]|nr:tryptophan-rich sensory protein [Pontiellaceae bacterium]HPR82813.1 tryptophan-rich sensory protein [Pontiellaceae bacterium]